MVSLNSIKRAISPIVVCIVLISFSVVSAPAFGAKIKSQCPHSIDFAVARYRGGGSDGPFDPGSWTKAVSSGWHTIAQFGEKEVPAGFTYIRIHIKGNVVTQTDLNDSNVKMFCINPRKRGNFDIWTHCNTGAVTKDEIRPVQRCRDQGGEWLPFIRVNQSSTYTVYNQNCNPSALSPNQTKYVWQESTGAFYYARQSQKEWAYVSGLSYDLNHEVRREGEQILIQRKAGPQEDRTYYLIRSNELLRKFNRPNEDWRKTRDGRWIR